MNRADFYQSVRGTVGNYLPLGFQKMPVLIHETEQAGQKTALLTLESGRAMPVMSLEGYLRSVEQGERPEQTMIRIGVDYTKHLVRERKKSQAYQR